MNPKKINSEELYAIVYGRRLLVFLEDGPQSNEYRQLKLSPDDYRMITDIIVRRNVAIERSSDETYKLPDLFDIHI